MKTIDAEAGENIWSFIRRAKKHVVDTGVVSAKCKFNQIEFWVYPESYQDDLVEIYGLKMEIERLKKR